MRDSPQDTLMMEDSRSLVMALLQREAGRLAGIAMIIGGIIGFFSIASWNVADPSLSHATDNPVTNWLGFFGASVADLLMQFFGLAAYMLLLPILSLGARMAWAKPVGSLRKNIAIVTGATILFTMVFGLFQAPMTWPLPLGLGGVIGDMFLSLPAMLFGTLDNALLGTIIALLLAVPACMLLLNALGQAALPSADSEGPLALIGAGAGAIAHWWYMRKARMAARQRQQAHKAPSPGPASERRAYAEPEFADTDDLGAPLSDDGLYEEDDQAEDSWQDDLQADDQDNFDDNDIAFDDDGIFIPDSDDIEDDMTDLPPEPGMKRPKTPIARPTINKTAPRVEKPAQAPELGNRIRREAQPAFLRTSDFELPELHMLSEPQSIERHASLSDEALEENARLLETVLEDFGVRGEIIHVRPGPVVTLYELEPAPGIKSSRVIGLADDIARSMSAIAARVAVVPGRNAIGIELPNPTRETVYLRALLASRDYEKSKAKLGLALGKTINGDSVIADLAKMPHLLVAGTTGSGKSVAINTMILSLLYKWTPQDCRLIMIDPKMLELSVYDGIPHLLTPVVTDPKKAVVALKWTVREMEDRYRRMSKLGVRNIDGFNSRVAQSKAKGEQISRTVQTGFDRDTGEAIYETEELAFDKMPYIVVIIDEMADLMMVAGKDIEGAVQRLAQMARAAGIHVVMATQRPSVDVITGTIKANFPTRISFQVTSKIDSRTILGEQGAEQLLGMGDMLYMAGGGKTQRVHGPFVSDDEVEKVVAHLKMQGVPEYLDAITEDDDEEDAGSGKSGSGSTSGMEESDDPYDQAVAVVLRDRKASTSYIQRRLGIGYNRAASIIERMEDEGVIGAANHAGKREILVPDPDEVM